MSEAFLKGTGQLLTHSKLLPNFGELTLIVVSRGPIVVLSL